MKTNPIHKPCGKVRYQSKGAAIGSAIRSSRRSGTPLRTYRCPTCKGWHLTKLPEWHERQQAIPPAPKRTGAVLNEFGHQGWCSCSTCAWLEPLPA